MHKHGEKRGFGVERVVGKEVSFTDVKGQEVYRGAGSSLFQTTSETYCEHCRRWIQTNGVMGPLKFMADHDSGDCGKTEASV